MHGDQQRTHRQPQVSQLEGKRELLQLRANTSATSAHLMCAGGLVMKTKETHPIHSYTDITYTP